MAAEGANKNPRPNTGREFDSRGSTRIALRLRLRSAQSISWTDNGVSRLALLIRATGRVAPAFRPNARGWFSAGRAGAISQSGIAFLSAPGPLTRPGHGVCIWSLYYMCVQPLVKEGGKAIHSRQKTPTWPPAIARQRCEWEWRPCNKKAPTRGFRVGETGLEPATSAMSTQCSNQLSYPPGSRLIL